MRTLLVIGSDRRVVEGVQTVLARPGLRFRLAFSAAEGLQAHRDDGADLVLLLLPFAESTGLQLLRQVLAQDPRGTVVVTGRDAMIPGAPEAVAAGAFDWVPHPLTEPQDLLTVVSIALGTRKNDAQLRYLRRKDAASADWQTLVGHCSAMRRVFATIRQVCHRTSTYGAPTILVTGETGTGKGLIAKTIHYNSARRSRSFVDINCTSLPASLVEAELFGHVKGAFTDARASRSGLFETADGGTLFLDEIGSLEPELQAKLLGVIEDKEVRRLGASEGVEVDVQVIAATHRDLHAMVGSGDFREDLFHRLNVIHIELPPLRERQEDRVLLAEAFLRDTCREYGVPERSLGASARAAIESYDWPGNVRELSNQIERIVLLSDDEVIEAGHLHLAAPTRSSAVVEAGVDRVHVSLPEGSCSIDRLTDAVEREVIQMALERHAGNVSQTARYLQVTRQSLIYRMRKHDLR